LILVTRLDGSELALNSDLIVEIEACPDTTVRLLNGESLIVRESVEELVESVADFRAGILARSGLLRSDVSRHGSNAAAAAGGHAVHLRFLPGKEQGSPSIPRGETP
jgi:flagellar protein FlbD